MGSPGSLGSPVAPITLQSHHHHHLFICVTYKVCGVGMEAGELSFSSPYSSDWGGGVSVSPQVCQVYSVRKDEHLHKTLRQTRPKAPGGWLKISHMSWSPRGRALTRRQPQTLVRAFWNETSVSFQFLNISRNCTV